MSRMLFLMLLLLPAAFVSGQNVNSGRKSIDVDQMNGPIFMTTSSNTVFPQDKYLRVVEGSPFFNNSWLKSNYINPVTKKNVIMRLDLLSNEVHYKDENGNILISTTPIKQLLLVDTVRNIQYHFLHSSVLDSDKKLIDGWYQEIIFGKASLYKHHGKQVTETLPYGQATYEQKIFTVSTYYVMKDNELVKLKKINDLENVLYERSKEVAAYLKSKKLKGKDDEDYYDTISMYNQLFTR
ncbi:hypothetical protein [Aridibaculum aurantiacum]|uniref:hypothetical protein n=1 Tax=Aridibaculum aurantiacum TaxID=2810307 RepID=UPI001A96131B|nr:hypothetical protein [Aridibaculum aurantiacum]